MINAKKSRIKRILLPALIVVLVFSVVLSACQEKGPSESELLATDAAMTVAAIGAVETAKAEIGAELTQAAGEATITPLPTQPLPPTAPPAQALPPATQNTPLAPAGGTGGDRADFVSETIPDGTRFDSGTTFTKSWTLQNTGSATWTADYAVVFVSGDQMGAVEVQKLDKSYSPEMVAKIDVDFVAPDKLGTYKAEFKLRNAAGEVFGLGPEGLSTFWVQIEVANLPTATTTVEAAPTWETLPNFIQSVTLDPVVADGSQPCNNYKISLSGEFQGDPNAASHYDLNFVYQFKFEGTSSISHTEVTEGMDANAWMDFGPEVVTKTDATNTDSFSVWLEASSNGDTETSGKVTVTIGGAGGTYNLPACTP